MTPVAHITFRQRLAKIFFFFPFQLALMHFKRNHLLLVFWALLFGFVSGNLASRYGVPHLFIAPEYLGNVGFWSFFIIGICLGSFIITFNIASYAVNGSKFPFIATLNRPFLKYAGNNCFFPLAFLLLYIYCIVSYDLHDETQNPQSIFIHVFAIILGTFLSAAFSYIYFFSTNKNIFSLFGITKDDKKWREKTNPKNIINGKKKWWSLQAPLTYSREWRVETYLSSPFKIRLARGHEHYEKEMIIRVFNQNQMNATRFQVMILILLFFLGIFRDIKYFQIPAGASILLILNMFLIITSVLQTWLRGWSNLAIIALLLLFNQFSKYEKFAFANFVYGMNYTELKADYSNENIAKLRDDTLTLHNDIRKNLEMLNNWRLKNSKTSLIKKRLPKLVIINTSGGGLRAALWTFHSILHADSVLKGELLKHTHFITGASGGMLGAAYLRELYLQSQTDSSINIYSNEYRNNISKDLLNAISFTIAINDLFFRFQKFSDGNYFYTKDRGYAFEQHFNENTNGILNKRLKDYSEPEAKGLIPMMIFSPVIVNDARRLLISSQPISYLTKNTPLENVTNNALLESVEFTRFFSEQNSENAKFTSILRMNATFPYILPNVSLPSEPTITVMDAGLRDNFGMLTTLKYIYTFRNWIRTNTSGVVIIEIRDRFKEYSVKKNSSETTLQSLFTPFGALYNNLTTVQTYNEDDLLMYASAWFDGKIDIIPFQLKNEDKDPISLSWHLTEKEKKQILTAIELPENKEAIWKLKILLE